MKKNIDYNSDKRLQQLDVENGSLGIGNVKSDLMINAKGGGGGGGGCCCCCCCCCCSGGGVAELVTD